MWDFLAKIDRLQNARMFKIIASVVVVLASVGAFGFYAVKIASERENLPLQMVSGDVDKAAEERVNADPNAPADPSRRDAVKREAAKALREGTQSLVNSINSIIEGRLSLWNAGFGAGVACAVLLLIVWLGLAITFVSIAVLLAAGCGPVIQYGSPWWQGIALFVAGIVTLSWCFVALIQTARLMLIASNPVTAVAQNVICEAVRMKVSLVFVALLILALAGLPGSLDAGSPLRYRVQAFLSYGVEASFWIIAVLVVFLSCATVAFEQRDKIIWQTMTKPVKHWQYVLGKWVGVMTVAGVLLGVSSGGVFLFTEYLHMQPAQGEIRPFLPAAWDQNESITPDRLILETQVLTARAAIPPAFPELDPVAIKNAVLDKIKRIQQSDPGFVDNEQNRQVVLNDFQKELASRWLSIAPGDRSRFVFNGLQYAKDTDAPVTLRFKVNAGANTPTDTYLLTFATAGMPPMVLQCRLDQFMSQPLPPLAIERIQGPHGEVEARITLDVWNGDPMRGKTNRETMTFPVGGLEISYPVSSFRANYFRAILMLWIKLGFLAIVGIAAATFLSFPVAALLAFGVFLCAEGAGFLAESLNSYDVMDQREVLWWRYPVVIIAQAVSWTFSFYVKLRPIQNLAEGRLISWLNVTTAFIILGSLTTMIWAIGAYIFRRRELATYSGQ